MPQTSLPIFQEGDIAINEKLSYRKEDGCIWYYNWAMPVFHHAEDDLQSFRMITAQFYVNGGATQAEICRAFGIPPVSMKRAVKRLREGGSKAFFAEPRRRGPAVLTAEVIKEVQSMLDEGQKCNDIADELTIKRDTLRKAVTSGRLHKQPDSKKKLEVTSRSERSIGDATAPLGMGATNTLERVMASLGKLEQPVSPKFSANCDIEHAGVICALPALIACGLLRHCEKYFSLPKGYYGLHSIFCLLAFLALLRVKSIEQVRYETPGEWGKLLGLDRIPEVRTLREKIRKLAIQGSPQEWSFALCKDWMQSDNESSHILYVDGHVRVYHGSQTKLPRHYVARERLCLQATVDYWVNAMDGQPFFLVNKVVDPGLIKTLEGDIVPKLLELVPDQPTSVELDANPLLHRFTIVFDREGYSPDLFCRLRNNHRIAIISYRKGKFENWPLDEFTNTEVTLSDGNVVNIMLAERGVFLAGKIWVREVRKLTSSGKQISILSTNYLIDLRRIAVAMFARWSQENFFRYMRQHYCLDRLIDYRLDDVPDDTKVVNPKYREVSNQIRRKAGSLGRKRVEYAAISLKGDIEKKLVETYQTKKADLKEQIEQLEEELNVLKDSRKNLEKHILFTDLPEEEKFKQLATPTKHFVDTIKMVAYRAETAMTHELREAMSRQDDRRSLLRSIYRATADILPCPDEKVLMIRLHHLANPAEDRAALILMQKLNATETRFPGSDFRLIFELVSK